MSNNNLALENSNHSLIGYLLSEEKHTPHEIGLFQIGLRSLGYEISEVNSRFGPQTQEALRNYVADIRAAAKDPENAPGQTIEELISDPFILQRFALLEQAFMKSPDYQIGEIDGFIGRQSAREIIDYMKNNPDAIGDINFGLLKKIHDRDDNVIGTQYAEMDGSRYDSRTHLEQAMRGSQSYVDRLESLSELKNDDEMTTAQGYEFQTLLAAGGFDPGGIDGAPGPKTMAAYERFENWRDNLPENSLSRNFNTQAPDTSSPAVSPEATFANNASTMTGASETPGQDDPKPALTGFTPVA